MFFIKKNDSASFFQTRKDALQYMNNSFELLEINSYFKIEVDTSQHHEHYLSLFIIRQ